MKILCIGPLWRGSNAGGLFKALNRQGVLIEVVDEYYHISLQRQMIALKISTRLLRPWQIKSFNQAILAQYKLFQPDIVLVYKGAFIQPQTLTFIKEQGCKVVNFYPDVSLFSHGKLLPKTMGLYDLVFTTKTFGVKDMNDAFGLEKSIFIPHGFDPEIHHLTEGFQNLKKQYACDVSFIGTWSPKKEKLLSFLKNENPNLNLRIWGSQWGKAKSENLSKSIMLSEVRGDLYATAISASKINLGILSEKVKGASSGDLITSRTFHIPGSGGFLLHERNRESILYFSENHEAAFFESPEELSCKVRYFLNHSDKREEIRLNGYKRAQKSHSLDHRAATVLSELRKLLPI